MNTGQSDKQLIDKSYLQLLYNTHLQCLWGGCEGVPGNWYQGVSVFGAVEGI